MTQQLPTEAKIGFADGSATRPALRSAFDRSVAYIGVSHDGERHDFTLPADNSASANLILEAIADLGPLLEDEHYKVLKFPLASGDVYVSQVNSAGRRAEKAAQRILANISKDGKHTPAHIKQMLQVRQQLKIDLADIIPGQVKLRSLNASEVTEVLESDEITEDVVKRSEAFEKLEGRKLRNASRKAFKRARGMNYADDIIVEVDLKFANRLKRVNTVLTVVEFAPAVARIFVAKTDQERDKAIRAAIAKGAGALAGEAIQKGGLALCVIAGVASGGWLFLACGFAVVAVGIYAGQYAEDTAKSWMALD
ncbi:hypothetical protein [Rhizobium laguerreae]|uniref:Uncharacterized protein n=1 Tax=Rhizobium laguerreae TaxID=1076926 RepID=A0A6N9Z8Z1_9HYPH|nr:hypothetical protein [Rhizobium laguerreae]NEH89766.1 hypothetical protein [Rhizobium laguerreae]